jgi:dolichyl-phosphate-mannose--protein O-mannosyl transferase
MFAHRRVLLTCLLLYVVGQTLFLVNIESVTRNVFDERFYLPAAREWLAWQDTTNPEHPPLGKQLIALGIAIWGDRPLGWRFMSTVFGSLTLVGMYLWARALFRNERTALLAAALSLGNQLLYVQSRVGMLDVFTFGFAVFGLAAVCAAWDPSVPARRARALLQLAGVAFGLSTACKWMGVVAWATAAAAVVGVRLLARAGVRGREDRVDAWYAPGLFASVNREDLLNAFVVLPVGVYLLTFLPYLFTAHQPRYSLIDIFRMQRDIWDLQRRVVDVTTYASAWTTWPLMRRPVWYVFAWEPDRSAVRGVVFLGNPLVMWGGLIALVVCAWDWIRRGTRAAFWIVLAWAALYLSYAVIPRNVTYYFYYYPAAMTLSLAIAYIAHRWEVPARGAAPRVRWLGPLIAVATFTVFLYFFDLLSGAKVGTEAFRPRMWFRSWY